MGAIPLGTAIAKTRGSRYGQRDQHGTFGVLQALVVLLVVVALVGVGFVAWSRWQSRPADPTTVGLPRLTDELAASRYLDKRGAPLITFLDVTTSMPVDASPRLCQSMVSDKFIDLPSPPELGSLAAGVPDAALRDALSNHVHTVVKYLGVCGVGDDVAEAAADVTFTATIAHRLVDQVRE